MTLERLEVRLDPERRRKLRELAAQKQVPVSEAVRRLIDEAYEEIDRARRVAIVERMKQGNDPVPEDPEELGRFFARRLDFRPIC